ncbi:MAG: acetylxylan esterase [Actinomycetota bacterium]|nr:acetylxylan esterase [Actinomycetota bacterium]
MDSSRPPEKSGHPSVGAGQGKSGLSGSPLRQPPDFVPFWERTRAELGRVAPDVSCEPLRTEDPSLKFDAIEFGSLGEVRVSGYVIRWKDEARRPLIVHSHGYGGGLDTKWRWARAGANVVGVEIRGYGRSRDALPSPSSWGYVLTGIESPEEHVLRGAVCDYMRAVEVGREILGSATSRTILNGTSFAGGLAVMSEAVMQIADLLVAAVPSFGWVEGRRVLAKEGSGQEINHYLEAHPEREEDVVTVLSYFDPVNFAGWIRCPTLIGVGLVDEVVPAPTVYAIADHLSGPHEVIELPVSHTDLPEERLWEKFEAYWLRLATEGILADFGKEKP